jgi:hypothetical protein
MASFTVRVELHDADESDYETLHEAMEDQGFSRTIVVNGVRRHLPTAEYVIDGSHTRVAVMEKAMKAAKKTLEEYSVLVTESKGRRVYNLKKF